jgi:hypothetical protein
VVDHCYLHRSNGKALETVPLPGIKALLPQQFSDQPGLSVTLYQLEVFCG